MSSNNLRFSDMNDVVDCIVWMGWKTPADIETNRGYSIKVDFYMMDYCLQRSWRLEKTADGWQTSAVGS